MLTAKPFRNTVFLLLISVFLQSFSFLSIKYSTLQTGIASLLLLGFAFGFLALRAILWQFLLKIADLSHVYPFAALVQPLILIYAVVLFKETVTPANIAGLLVMLVGVYFMSRRV
jgi:drug/metabolite transporter (DMT)-like permease